MVQGLNGRKGREGPGNEKLSGVLVHIREVCR